MSAFVIKSGPYAGYRVEVGDDFPKPVYYGEAVEDGTLIRVHYRVSRLPAEKSILLRHLSGSTDTDRENALRVLGNIGARFKRWEQRGAVNRTRWKLHPEKWLFWLLAGTRVDDPLVQLELEMMIDLNSSTEVGL